MTINYSDIPGHQNLFLDYMYEFENVEKFYAHNFREDDKYPDLFAKIAKRNPGLRDELINITLNQYSDFQPSKQTISNIESLGNDNTIAIITGQQLGMFGGPLYTFYKTITAVKLANFLNDKFTDYNFVPIFWLEGDDHDFDEIKSFNLIDASNNIKNIAYEDGLKLETNRGSTAKIKINKNIDDIFYALQETLRENDFKADIMAMLKNNYQPNQTLEYSFRALMFEVFDEEGLVIFNPNDDKVKTLLKPVFEKEIRDFRPHTDTLVTRSAELEELYHAQVKVKPVNLFINEKDGRYSLEPDGKIFKVKNKRIQYTQDELLNILSNEPERFSPNVLLRPICQDYLFPTGFYVAGPAEIAYFAQITPLYDYFAIESPIIYPRASATILEKNITKVLDKYELSLMDIYIEEKLLTHRIMKELSPHNLDTLFEESKRSIDLTFDNLTEKLFGIDNNLKDVADKSRQKVYQTLEQLDKKARQAEERTHDTALRQIERARLNLFPDGVLQERKLNFIYFAHKYGINILKWISNELSVTKFEHQILEI
ncbi:MAG: putative cysteine ligase BshC [Melioribacteraceae bacterium]|nr:MAG: putative cysteine ligase BshC [Melioribacteraceae bacterium]